jgi:hypothetical protein
MANCGNVTKQIQARYNLIGNDVEIEPSYIVTRADLVLTPRVRLRIQMDSKGSFAWLTDCDPDRLVDEFGYRTPPYSLPLGLNTGMGKPAVIPQQVSWVWVQFWFLAHCNTPHTHAMVSGVCMGKLQ